MLLHHLPLSRPAYMDLPQWHWAWPSSAPSAGWAASAGDQQGWGWGLSAQDLCSGTHNVECSSLGGVWPALWPGVTSFVPTHGAQVQCSSPETPSPGARCYQLSLVRAFVERKSPPPVGDRNIGNSALMAGSQRRWRNLVRLTKNSEGRLQLRVKPGMPGSSACLLWGAFKVPVFKWINVIFNGKRKFFKMLQCGAKKILSLVCTQKSLTLLFLPPTFPFQQERWKKKQEKEVKWDDFFFKLKKTFSHWKYLNINKYKLANNQTTNFILMKHN